MTTIFLVATGGGSQARPGDWSNTNSAEVIGGGGGGSRPSLATTNANGGGGGGYSKISNFVSASATFFFSIGTGGAGGAVDNGSGSTGLDTWIRLDGTNSAPTTTAQGTLAKAGVGAANGAGSQGAGGASA